MNRRPSILRLTMTIGQTSAPYNQFSLPLQRTQEITLCSYLPPTVTPSPELTVLAGDGTIPGFYRALRQALAHGPYDLVHVHDPVVANLALPFAIANKDWQLSQSLFTIHNSYENFKARNRLLLLPIFALYRKVIGCSRASYQSFPTLYRRLAGERFTYVPNGMDIERVDRTLQENVSTVAPTVPPHSGFTIISVGRLIPIKNPLTLLKAFIESDLPDGRLVYVGVGPLAAAIEARATAAGVADRVELTGLLSREEVYHRVNTSDLFVSTSYGEGLPIAVLEAMACRTPVVLSDIVPHQEIAGDHSFMPLLPADDHAGFGRSIRRLAAISTEERAVIGDQCRRLVENEFSLTRMHQGYAAIYGEVSKHFQPSPSSSYSYNQSRYC